MKYSVFLSAKKLSILLPFFKSQLQQYHLDIATKILLRIGLFLGFETGVRIPRQLLVYGESVWPALQIINILKQEGIVTSFFHEAYCRPDEPRFYMTRILINGKQRTGYAGTSSDLLDRDTTVWPAIGEAIERWSMDNFRAKDSECCYSSYETLTKPKLNITKVVGFSSELRSKKHPRFNLEYDVDTSFRWMSAQSLTKNQTIYAPLQLFSNHHIITNASKIEGNGSEPLLRPPVSTGLATGQSKEDAVLRGLLEVIERDAFMIHWLNMLPSDQIDITTIPDSRFRKVEEIQDRHNLEVYLLYLQTDVPVHTVMSLVIDRTGVGPAVMVGASSDFDLADAAYGAVLETLAFRSSVRNSMETNLPGMDFSDQSSIGHKDRILYWCQKEKIPEIEFWTKGSIRHFKEFKQFSNTTDNLKLKLKTLTCFFKDNNYEVVYKEIINAKLKQKLKGLSVVKVVIPEFQPLSLQESLPAKFGNRLQDIPPRIGFIARERLNPEVHPFP